MKPPEHQQSNIQHLWLESETSTETEQSQTAAPAEDSPVCDSQTLSLINQA